MDWKHLFYPVILAVISVKSNSLHNARSEVIWEGDKPIIPLFYTPQKSKPPIDPNIARAIASDNEWQINPGVKLAVPKFLFSNQDDEPFYGKKDYLKNKLELKSVIPDTSKVLKHSFKVHDNLKFKPLDEFKSADHDYLKSQNTDGMKHYRLPMLVSNNQYSNENIHNSATDPVKYRIIALAEQTVKGLTAKAEVVNKVHERYKYNKMYKLGYVVSYINKTREGITTMMKYMENNKDSWDVIKVLNTYEQIKKTKEFLSEMLSVLKHLEVASTHHHLSDDVSNIEKQRVGVGNIAWSYYDENI